MNWFTNNIFELFGKDYKRRDSYKDVYGEGLTERFTKTLATSFDDLKDTYLDTLLDNIYNPFKVPERLLIYLEYNLGINLYLGESNRRKVIKNITKYYQIKGTQKSYDVLFGVLGMEATISVTGSLAVTNFDTGGIFNSGLKFDNTTSSFNLTCLECMEYSIAVTGTATLTEDLKRAMYSIALFNEPINYVLTNITYNGTPIASESIYILLSNTDILASSSTDLIIAGDL